MKFAIVTVLIVYSCMMTIFFGYDFFVYKMEQYSHYHMGRWNDKQKWKAAINIVCKKWLIKTPTLRLKKDCRYLLLDRITGKYGKNMVQSWQKAGCLLGLEEAGESQKFHDDIKNQLLNQDGSWKKNPKKVDYAMMAYALLKNERQPETIRPAMDSMLECIESNLCADGLISYSGGKQSKRRYVDTLGFVCPFLGLYGKIYHKSEYISLAVNQISVFSKIGISNGLPFHCYETETELPIGVLGWGRGTGWLTLAMIDLYDSVSDEEQKAYLREQIQTLAERILEFECADGGFTAILAAGTPYDSSATAMLGYYLARCGLLLERRKYTEAAERCVSRLMRETKINGVIDNCQGDTIDIGIFSERYAEMPFAQGIALRLASVLKD